MRENSGENGTVGDLYVSERPSIGFGSSSRGRFKNNGNYYPVARVD
jgi:hypothetical protein